MCCSTLADPKAAIQLGKLLPLSYTLIDCWVGVYHSSPGLRKRNYTQRVFGAERLHKVCTRQTVRRHAEKAVDDWIKAKLRDSDGSVHAILKRVAAQR